MFSVEHIHKALRWPPARVIQAWANAGGRMELVYGRDARIHPRSVGGPPCSGWTSYTFCCVAADCEAAYLTALHELAHAYDCVLDMVSFSQRWRDLFGRLKRDEALPRAFGQSEDWREYFAESCGLLWRGWGNHLPFEVAAFIGRLP
jgi:hypothetical protein